MKWTNKCTQSFNKKHILGRVRMFDCRMTESTLSILNFLPGAFVCFRCFFGSFAARPLKVAQKKGENYIMLTLRIWARTNGKGLVSVETPVSLGLRCSRISVFSAVLELRKLGLRTVRLHAQSNTCGSPSPVGWSFT